MALGGCVGVLKRLPYAVPMRLSEMPCEWFTPSFDLPQQAWPDFRLASLADWSSSRSPAPSVPDDCCLVLACTRVIPPVEPAGGWTLLTHETGGIWHERMRTAVCRIPVGLRGQKVIHAIARAMAHSNCSSTFAPFDQLINYRTMLQTFGLDCNRHIQALAEGFYPIDPHEAALQILQADAAPVRALEVASPGTTCLAVMAPNCSAW